MCRFFSPLDQSAHWIVVLLLLFLAMCMLEECNCDMHGRSARHGGMAVYLFLSACSAGLGLIRRQRALQAEFGDISSPSPFLVCLHSFRHERDFRNLSIFVRAAFDILSLFTAGVRSSSCRLCLPEIIRIHPSASTLAVAAGPS